MKKYLAVLAIFSMLVGSTQAWEKPAKPEVQKVDPETVKVVRWEGETDYEMLKTARNDIDTATVKDSKIKTLKVLLASPGGPVITSLEIARLVRDAYDKKGLVIEIHASMLCTSGCTFILAAGTPGYRYISSWALFLVHGPQAGSMFGPMECISYREEEKTQEDKLVNTLLNLMRDSLLRYIEGSKPSDVENWITCGYEKVGRGEVALKLGFVDKVE